MNKILAATAALFLLSACSTWLGGEEDVDRSNLDKRIPVLKLETTLSAEDDAKAFNVTVPEPFENTSWHQYNDQNIPRYRNLALAKELTKRTTVKAGEGAQEHFRLMAPPVIAEDTVFILDGEGYVQAYDLNDFKKFRWKTKTLSRERREGVTGGGLSYADGILFATNGLDTIFALDPKTGATKWQKKVGSIIRSAPTVSEGMVYALSVDNKLYALSVSDGAILWTHEGFAENLGLLGSPSPAVVGNIIVVPHSSGEMFGLEARSGMELWADNISFRSADSFSFVLPDIEANPIIAGGAVFAGSYHGLLLASNLKQGTHYWEHETSLTRTPWVAGDFLYALTEEHQLVAIHIPTGKVKWVQALPAYEDEKDKTDKITWTAPVMAGSFVRIVSSNGKLLTISPQDGSIVSETEVIKGVYAPPVVAINAMYLLNNDGELLAIR